MRHLTQALDAIDLEQPTVETHIRNLDLIGAIYYTSRYQLVHLLFVRCTAVLHPIVALVPFDNVVQMVKHIHTRMTSAWEEISVQLRCKFRSAVSCSKVSTFLCAGVCCIAIYWSRSTTLTVTLAAMFIAIVSVAGIGVISIVVEIFPTSLR
uniref:Uncharacterized protein n=1 Tax=Timema cristinae TaxID=61476 RepID=A0A7R9DMF4_TIMCR|nr:unnamed protein product [Timema cristinae]